ncbi:MAG: hypothetical protein AB1486_24205 [Planctomycetota bacterium]
MRKTLLIVWLLVPVAAGAYHFGPGQKRLALDEVARLVQKAEEHVQRAHAMAASEGDFAAQQDWLEAEAAYTNALEQLPADKVTQRQRVQLERAKVRMFIGHLPLANVELGELVEEMMAAAAPDRELLAEARSALANSQYYMTWLLRLEGATREEWEPRIEAARQTYKLLAEEAEEAEDTEALQENKENLESTIRLARMDLQELQGLPIPSQ